MHIIIDTNILVSDFLIKSRRFEMLLDYARKTDNRIMLPEVVFREVLGAYERDLIKKYKEVERTKSELDRRLIEGFVLEIPEIEISSELTKYEEHLKKTFHLFSDGVIPLNNEHLPNLVDRAIQRVHPFTEKRQEFRDSLIWFSVIETALSAKEKQVIFISSNTKDFAGTEKQLHPCLKAEADEKGVVVDYFVTLDDFIKSHASTIEFITEDWINSEVDLNTISENIIAKVGKFGNKKLEERAQEEFKNFSSMGVINPIQTWLSHFYVYEMSDGTHRIEVTYETELEVECYKHEVLKDYYDHDYEFDPISGEFEPTMVSKKRVVEDAAYDYIYPVAESEYHLIVEDNKIKKIEFIDWYV